MRGVHGLSEARWNEARAMNHNGLATGGMDLSDGLSDALQSIAAPGSGAVIDIESLPYNSLAVAAAAKYSIPLFNLAFSVGDWAILYAVKPEHISSIRLLAKEDAIELTEIGRVTDEEGIYGIDKNGEAYEVDGIVNENFRSRMEDQGNFFDSIRSKVALNPLVRSELKEKIVSALDKNGN